MRVPAFAQPVEVSFAEASIPTTALFESTLYNLFSDPVAVIKEAVKNLVSTGK